MRSRSRRFIGIGLLVLPVLFVATELTIPIEKEWSPCGPQEIGQVLLLENWDEPVLVNRDQGKPTYSRKSKCIEGTERLTVKRPRLLKRIVHIAYEYDAKDILAIQNDLARYGFDTSQVRTQFLESGRVLLNSINNELLISFIPGIGSGPIVTAANLKW